MVYLCDLRFHKYIKNRYKSLEKRTVAGRHLLVRWKFGSALYFGYRPQDWTPHRQNSPCYFTQMTPSSPVVILSHRTVKEKRVITKKSRKGDGKERSLLQYDLHPAPKLLWQLRIAQGLTRSPSSTTLKNYQNSIDADGRNKQIST